MKRKDLRSLKNTPDLARQMEGIDPAAVEQVQHAVEQYQGKSEGELYDELRRKVNDGNVSQARISEMAEKLLPLLDAGQQQRLRAIVNDLKRKQ